MSVTKLTRLLIFTRWYTLHLAVFGSAVGLLYIRVFFTDPSAWQTVLGRTMTALYMLFGFFYFTLPASLFGPSGFEGKIGVSDVHPLGWAKTFLFWSVAATAAAYVEFVIHRAWPTRNEGRQ